MREKCAVLLTSLSVFLAWTGAAKAASSYTWTPTTTGTAYTWTNPPAWGGGGFPDGPGDMASLTNNIGGAQTISLTQPITIGTLNIGDRASGYAVFTLQNGTGGSLTFDAGSGNAQINKIAAGNSVADVVAATIQLTTNLDVANLSTNGGGLTLSGSISGGFGLSKSGRGTVTLSGSNSFSGGLTILEGMFTGTTLSNAFGGGLITLGATSGSANVILNNGLAYGSPNNPTNIMPQSIRVASGNTGNATIGASVAMGGGVFSGPVTLDNHDVILATVGSAGNMAVTLRGGISGTGDVHLAPASVSGSQVVLAGAPVNMSGRIISRGGGAGSTISCLLGSEVTRVVQDGRNNSLSMTVSNSYPNGFLLRSGQLNVANANGLGTGTLWLGDDSETNNEPVLFGSSGSAAPGVTNPIVLGDRAVYAGIIRIGVLAGGGFVYTGSITGNNDIVLAANLPSSGGACTFSGSLNHSGSVVNASTASGSFTISGVLGPNVTRVGQDSPSSRLILSGVNTCTGTVFVSEGTLEIKHVNALQSATFDTMAEGTQVVAFTVSGVNTYNLGGLAGTNGLVLGVNTLRVGGNGRDTVYAGTFSVTGAPAASLIKTGAGTLTLARSSGIATGGGIVVSNGTLRVNGSSESAPIKVLAGAVLGGTGTVSVANLTLASGARLGAVVFPDGASEALTVNGALNLATLGLEIADTSQLVKRSYTVLRCGSHSGAFATNNLPERWLVDYSLADAVMIRSRDARGAFISIR